jgi:Beta-lactamase superfamily domain
MEFAITHITAACTLLEIGSARILTDPVLDEGSKVYHLGPLVWIRRHLGPAIRKDALRPPDAVLLSHFPHLDDLDNTGREVARNAPLVITGPHETHELDFPAVDLKPWDTTAIPGKNVKKITVTATPGVHGPWWLPETHRVVGFELQWEVQQNGLRSERRNVRTTDPSRMDDVAEAASTSTGNEVIVSASKSADIARNNRAAPCLSLVG